MLLHQDGFTASWRRRQTKCVAPKDTALLFTFLLRSSIRAKKDSIVSVASIRRSASRVMEDPAEAGLSLGFIRLAGTDLPVPSVLMYILVAVSDILFSVCVTANRVFGLSS